jgi:hypothetical protein
MPVEGAIPKLAGVEMYGNSIPAERAGGDLFEYINFQQRYNIDARIGRSNKLARQYLEPHPDGLAVRNPVDAHLQWLESRPDYTPDEAAHYRKAKTDPAVAVALTASPGNMAGGLAWHASVIAGGFLHPNGVNARTANAETWQKDLKAGILISFSSPVLERVSKMV